MTAVYAFLSRLASLSQQKMGGTLHWCADLADVKIDPEGRPENEFVALVGKKLEEVVPGNSTYRVTGSYSYVTSPAANTAAAIATQAARIEAALRASLQDVDIQDDDAAPYVLLWWGVSPALTDTEGMRYSVSGEFETFLQC